MKYILLGMLALGFTKIFAQNVGIGITTPDEKLHVDSVIRVGKNAVIAAGSTRKNTIKFGDGNFATIGEQDKDDRLVLNAGSFSFKTGNVGIGVDSAKDKLDVNGDIRADTIIPNAIKMQTNGGVGKVLTSDAAGIGTWQSIGSQFGYKKCKQINTTGASNFIIPAGVTEIMVELWGAGSGGVLSTNLVSYVIQGQYFGGSSGGYASTVQTVTPGYNLTFNIGVGGSSHAYNVTGLDGGSSSVTFANGNLIAYGGKTHLINSYQSSSVQSGTGTLPNYIIFFGNSGGFPTFRTDQTNATDYWKIVTTGDGGRPIGFLNPLVQRGSVLYFLNGSFLYDHNESASVNNYPSSGGACTSYTNSGGDGMLLIWYN